MEVGSDVRRLLLLQSRKRWHTSIWPALLQERSELLSTFVLEDDDRVQKVRSALASPRVRSVAKRASGSKSSFPPLTGGLVVALEVLTYLALQAVAKEHERQ